MKPRIDPHAPFWLTARPIAHRGLHRAESGIVENTIRAADAAIARGYAIECDVELTRDGEAVVFHDERLERLTLAQGRVNHFLLRELQAAALRDDPDSRIPALPDFLAAVAGRVPLILEIKSRFDGDFRLAARTLEALADYEGPVALKSFDPLVVAFLRARRAPRPLGLVAQAAYEAKDWPDLSLGRRRLLAAMADFAEARPDFLSWSVSDLPHAAPTLCAEALGLAVMTWTVRDAEDQALAAAAGAQIVFEGFSP